jgi:hypothetical protein
MTSNIEPIAREITGSICRENDMPEAQIDRWVELHWQCAAAMLEAGVMDEKGEWIDGKDWRRGLEACRERLACVYRKLRLGRSGGEVHQGSRVLHGKTKRNPPA